MQVFARSIIARITLAIISLWLGAGSARAGGGGADAPTLQTNLENLCKNVLHISFCPELPTASQMALSIAALRANPPELVRFAGGAFSPTDVITAVNPPAAPDVVPLAFIRGQPASVTERGDPEANSLFTAFTDRLTQMLNLTYDFSPPPSITKGQTFATLSLPLVILNNADSNGNFAEGPAPTTIVIQGASGTCKTTGCVPFSALATTKALGAANVDPAKLGVTIAVTTTGSGSSAHLIVTVQAPLVVWNTPDRDPSYFVEDPVLTGVVQFFKNNDAGFPSKLLASNQMGIGIAPYASPLCQNNARCIENPPTPAYSYCAALGSDQSVQAVAAFLSIGKFGETYASSLRSDVVLPGPSFTCPLTF